ncbi:uncharacterized protein MONBRDRAFT_10956 [Monosiga brevicollis MX1]|uniref:Uncharacterized protein n=1 Tax=Monosiga brevicollis TaxID=81824 RepID=A9V7R9_MONBE|nr:uncharacterized protein MONBRDRAFT_10956 [Monosiga brevicollis MX1]EDQ86355.1 predicted protein [Monosiga brevicollis MX1]|eukprot:XP_001748745.1 hypothetical protein [Monosiga brevicollis MX1]
MGVSLVLVALSLGWLGHLPAVGGEAAYTWAELFAQDEEGFRVQPPVSPAHRYNHASLYDAKRQAVLVTYGYFFDHRNHRPTYPRDVWMYELTARTWRRLSDDAGPSGRYGHAIAWLSTYMYHNGMYELRVLSEAAAVEVPLPRRSRAAAERVTVRIGLATAVICLLFGLWFYLRLNPHRRVPLKQA